MHFLTAKPNFTNRSFHVRRSAFFKECANKGGFNLVEVVLAMCVIAIAFTSLFGVMPVALQNYRHSMGLTTQANIMSQVSGELQQTPVSVIFPPGGGSKLTTRYFDDDGQEVTQVAQAVYRVDYTPPTNSVNAPASGGSPPSVNSTIFSGSGSSSNLALAPVTISIYNAHGTSTTPLSQMTLFLPYY